MNERMFRFILGATLMLLLFFRQEELIFAYIALLLFEGLTNWRVPILVSRLRYGHNQEAPAGSDISNATIPFEAERVLRFMVAAMLIAYFVLLKEQAWFFPWFVGFMLFMAGMTNICPMVIGLRWIGFR